MQRPNGIPVVGLSNSALFFQNANPHVDLNGIQIKEEPEFGPEEVVVPTPLPAAQVTTDVQIKNEPLDITDEHENRKAKEMCTVSLHSSGSESEYEYVVRITNKSNSGAIIKRRRHEREDGKSTEDDDSAGPSGLCKTSKSTDCDTTALHGVTPRTGEERSSKWCKRKRQDLANNTDVSIGNKQHAVKFVDHNESVSGDVNTTNAGSRSSTVNSTKDLTELLSTFIKKQSKIETQLKAVLQNQKIMGKRVHDIEKNLKMNMATKSDMWAQNKILRECKVVVKKVKNSLCRMTGETIDERLLSITSILPLKTVDDAMEVEEKLKDADYAQSMLTYIQRVRAGSDDVSNVLRHLFDDELLKKYNWDGRANKNALAQLSLASDVLYGAFDFMGRLPFENKARKAIELSHNRFKQKSSNRRKRLEARKALIDNEILDENS